MPFRTLDAVIYLYGPLNPLLPNPLGNEYCPVDRWEAYQGYGRASSEGRGLDPMSGGALVCGLISGALCLSGLFLYIIWIALLSRFLPKAERNGNGRKENKRFDDEIIDVEFEEK
jgi:hypothetical protein